MTLARYEVFRVIIETGSFSNAAKELNVTQSAISHAISSLEAEFGFTLLTRGRSGIQLTHNGEKILLHIHHILNEHEQMLQDISEIKGVKTGVIRIGIFPSVSINWVPKTIKSFNHRYPNIEIKLFEGDYDDISKWIADGFVDFGFLSLPTENSFETIPVKKDRILCIISDQHPLSSQDKLTFTQLKNEKLIMPKTNIDKDVRRILKDNKIIPSIRYEMEEDQAIIAMVENNLGISILPELILYRLPKNIRIIPLDGNYYRTIGIAANSFKNMAPAATMIIDDFKKIINE